MMAGVGRSQSHVIIKQGYLKKLPNASKLASTLKKPDRRWFVFGVVAETQPYLEYYADEDAAFTSRPINRVQLLRCAVALGVGGGGGGDEGGRYRFGFTLVLPERRLVLVTQTGETANEWVQAIDDKLRDIQLSRQTWATSSQYTEPPYCMSIATSQQHHNPPAYSPSLMALHQDAGTPPDGGPHYLLPAVAGRSPSAADLPPPQVSFEPPPLSAKMEDEDVAAAGDAIGGWNAPPPPSSPDAPPPYVGRKVLQRGTHRSLRRSQADEIQHEKLATGGASIQLRRSDVHNVLALVNCHNAVWVAGWCQRARPFLHNAFHIGDRIVSINGQVVESARVANKLTKACSDADFISFVFHRLPRAEVFVLERSAEGEDLGIRRAGGTAEITYVDVGGLASQQGMLSKATTLDSENFCNWWITEVNNRPLNLFFKQNEVEHRLNSVGKEISLVIQPADLIMELKRQLKLIRNYKDFIVQ